MKKLNLTIIKSGKSNPDINNNFIISKTEAKPNITKVKKKFKPSKKLVLIIITFLIFAGVIAFIYYRFNSYNVRVQSFDENGNATNTCTNILNPECWTDAFKPQLKQTNGYTNVLILGLDTRPNGSLLNTDSIIVGSYNHNTRKTMLISIPRDFYSQKYKVKISAVYFLLH